MDDNGYWPKYYTPNYSSVNCYAYVLGLTKERRVPVHDGASVLQVYNNTCRDIVNNLGRRIVRLGTNYYSTSFNSRYYYLIALRVGRGGNAWLGYSWDYHFMVRHENLTWSHKPGSSIPSMYIGSARYHNPSTMNWALYDDEYPYRISSCPYTNFNYYNYYNSATYYIAVEKRWSLWKEYGLHYYVSYSFLQDARRIQSCQTQIIDHLLRQCYQYRKPASYTCTISLVLQ